MKISDLKTGMTVQFNDGVYALVIGEAVVGLCNDFGGQKLDRLDFNTIDRVFNEGTDYDGSDLIWKVDSKERVEEYFLGELLWERPPKVEELTLEQVCKELGRDIKIVK